MASPKPSGDEQGKESNQPAMDSARMGELVWHRQMSVTCSTLVPFIGSCMEAVAMRLPTLRLRGRAVHMSSRPCRSRCLDVQCLKSLFFPCVRNDVQASSLSKGRLVSPGKSHNANVSRLIHNGQGLNNTFGHDLSEILIPGRHGSPPNTLAPARTVEELALDRDSGGPRWCCWWKAMFFFLLPAAILARWQRRI